MLDPWESVQVDVEEITETADAKFVTGVLMTTCGRDSGVETTRRMWQVFEATDGVIPRRLGPYWVRDEAFTAASWPASRRSGA